MRSFGRFFVLVGLVWCIGIMPVAAIDSTSSNTIIVTAEVLPIKSIILDSEGVIKKIISNSEKDGPIKVYLDEQFQQETALTPETQQRYDEIDKQYNLNKIGQVYPTITEISTPTKLLGEVIAEAGPTTVNVLPLIGFFYNNPLGKPTVAGKTYSIQTPASVIGKMSSRFSLQGS